MNLGIIAFLGLFWILAHTQLHLCLTSSLEGIRVLLFYKTPVHEIKHNDIVFIKGHDYRYLGVQPYSKRVIGFPRDPIIRENNALKVGSRILPLIEKTMEGHPLTPIAHDVVPEGYLFVAGDHPRSIDSRYEEFGLVPVGKIWGKGAWSW
jgi:type IV secretory pathway protease TraF